MSSATGLSLWMKSLTTQMRGNERLRLAEVLRILNFHCFKIKALNCYKTNLSPKTMPGWKKNTHLMKK